MSQSGIYSDLKMGWHMIRDGGLPDAPKQVQIILSDLCNQNCSFCLVGDTLVDIPGGQRYIRDVRAGDFVYGPNGAQNEVTKTSRRAVEEVIAIGVAGHTIKATAEHPILTDRGWIPAGEIRIGDSAVVRVRMRESGHGTSRIVEQISTGTSDAWTARQQKATCSGKIEDADEQSNEAAGNRNESLSDAAREATQSFAGSDSKYRGGSAQTHVVESQSDEKSSDASGGNGKDIEPSEIEKRDSLRAVVGGEWFAPTSNRRRLVLGREEKPRLPSGRPEKAGGVDAEGVFYRPEETPQRLGLRNEYNQALSRQGVGVLGDFQERSSLPAACAVKGCVAELHVAGICLERGLALRQVDSIRSLSGTFDVYNFSCSPGESYEADGIVVHNCAYRMDGYTSNELFVGSSDKAKYGTNNPVRMVPGPRAFALLDECKRLGVGALQFTGGGEPTVHKQHVEIFRRALDMGFACSLVSNGLAWGPQLVDILSQFSWVRVSLDAGAAETYAAIRQTPATNFSRVLRNITLLASTIEREQSDCVLGVGYVVTPDNWKEIRQATHLIRESGAAYVRLSAMFNPDNALPYQDTYADILKSVRDVKADYDSDKFTVHELFTDRLQDLFDGAPDYDRCIYQYYTAYVGGDMQAYRCCVLAYNKRGQVAGGDLTTRPFDEFWNSDERKRDYDGFKARGCERCQFNGKNRAANYLLGDKPVHAEFP